MQQDLEQDLQDEQDFSGFFVAERAGSGDPALQRGASIDIKVLTDLKPKQVAGCPRCSRIWSRICKMSRIYKMRLL
ncbi:hypothetical protein C6495_07160 [Candidatus Poribacteria bacterium]|nr:MAG: hypothetical protein C6495_07160 [Candidatus Poribacteria bacterium]